jgi:hypothetical protein
MATVTRGMLMLVMLLPVVLVGGLLVALLGKRGEVIIAAVMGGCGVVMGVLGLAFVGGGLWQHTRIQRKLQDLDRKPLPEARVVR